MSTDKPIVIDLSYLREVASDNTEFMVEMIDIFIAQTPGYVELLTNAIENKDWTKMAEMAHKIKPTFSFIGVESAQEKMAEIEKRSRDQEDYEGILADFSAMKPVFIEIFDRLEDKKAELLAQG
ncbi:MAG: Hpt domain-containing protein [Pelobium sp.]